MESFKTDNISIQGFSHVRIDKECQDNSLSWQTKKYDGIIVCDGHGGDKYFRSADGSRIACEVGHEIIDQFLAPIFEKRVSLNDRTYDALLGQVEKAIIQRWIFRIEDEIRQNPFASDERFVKLEAKDQKSLTRDPIKAYGTTFLAAVLSDDFGFILKLGDGNVGILYANGQVSMPGELADDQLQFNVTTSMCNSDVDIQFRHGYFRITDRNAISAVTLTSDGVINSFRTEDAYKSLIKNIASSYFEQQKKEAHDELEEFLHTLSEKGSGDDLSVAIICNKKNPMRK